MPLLDDEHLAWCLCNGVTIFLDIEKDRYFRLDIEHDRDFQATALANGQGNSRQPAYLPFPSAWRSPTASFDSINRAGFSLSGVAAAMWMQRRVERRLERSGLRSVLVELAEIRPRDESDITKHDGITPIVHAFEQARLLRSAADRCLPRSVALFARLAAINVPAELVIGVREQPFGAHCWVQQGSLLLNETVEEARRYEPILVI